jgi:hypothetical protein
LLVAWRVGELGCEGGWFGGDGRLRRRIGSL